MLFLFMMFIFLDLRRTWFPSNLGPYGMNNCISRSNKLEAYIYSLLPFFVMMSQLIINFMIHFNMKVNPSSVYKLSVEQQTYCSHIQNQFMNYITLVCCKLIIPDGHSKNEHIINKPFLNDEKELQHLGQITF